MEKSKGDEDVQRKQKGMSMPNEMKGEKRNKNRARQCTIRSINMVWNCQWLAAELPTLSGSFALIEVRNGESGVNYLGEWQQCLAMWALMGSPASDGIQGLCCVQDRTRSLLPFPPPHSSPFGRGLWGYLLRKRSFFMHMQIHTHSVSWRSLYCFWTETWKKMQA